MQSFESNDPDETSDFAQRFARLLKPGNLVLLKGDLGAGKTLFVRGICAGLGMVNLFEVDSPTYTILNFYDAGPGVHHLDLYRMQSLDELEDIEFEQLLIDDHIKIIEWPERLHGYPLPANGFEVTIKILDETKRNIRYKHRT